MERKTNERIQNDDKDKKESRLPTDTNKVHELQRRNNKMRAKVWNKIFMAATSKNYIFLKG